MPALSSGVTSAHPEKLPKRNTARKKKRSEERNQYTKHFPSDFFCRSCLDGSHFRGLSNLFSVLMPFPDRDAKSGIALPWSKRAQTYSQTLMSHKSITSLLAASKGGTQEPLSSSESSLHWRDVPWAGRGSSRATSAHLFHATVQHLAACPSLWGYSRFCSVASDAAHGYQLAPH